MKTNDLFMMAAAALGVYMIAKMMGGAGAVPGGGVTVGGANFNPTVLASDAGFGKLVATYNGWRYYDSGYGKGPDGSIYYQGQKVS